VTRNHGIFWQLSQGPHVDPHNGNTQTKALVLDLTPPAASKTTQQRRYRNRSTATTRVSLTGRLGIATDRQCRRQWLGFHDGTSSLFLVSWAAIPRLPTAARFAGAPRRGALDPLGTCCAYPVITVACGGPVWSSERLMSHCPKVRHSRMQWQQKPRSEPIKSLPAQAASSGQTRARPHRHSRLKEAQAAWPV